MGSTIDLWSAFIGEEIIVEFFASFRKTLELLLSQYREKLLLEKDYYLRNFKYTKEDDSEDLER